MERSAQHPQAFYPLPHPVRFDNGLQVAARCVFDASNSSHTVGIGSTRNDEMCNAYLMFYTEDLTNTYGVCESSSGPIELPDPDEQENAFKGDGHVHSHGPHHHGMNMPGMNMDDSEKETEVKSAASVSPLHVEAKAKVGISLAMDKHWAELVQMASFPMIGQVGGISTDRQGNVYVFHRAQRQWTSMSFDETKHFTHKIDGPITDNTVIVFAPNGTVIDRWGANKFYLPHGITVSEETNSIWLTDTALHQVFRYDFHEVMNREDKSQFKVEPNLILGKKFEPGSDNDHLCQPAAVATMSDGSAVIADGYCNNRLLIVAPSGKTVHPVELRSDGKAAFVVHDVVFDAKSKRFFAADRENGRVFVVNRDTHEVEKALKMDGRIYGLAIYAKCDRNFVFAMNQSLGGVPGGFKVIDSTSLDVESSVVLDENMEASHTFAIDGERNVLYVGQIFPEWRTEQIMRFNLSSNLICQDGDQSGTKNPLIEKIYGAHKEIYAWVSNRMTTPAWYVGFAVFVVSFSIVIVIAVVMCRLCRRRGGSPTSRRPPKGSAGRDYSAQYSLLVGDAATKRAGGRRQLSGLEDLSDDDEDDIIDRRMVSRPPGGGAKSRYTGLPAERESKFTSGDKIV